MARVIVLFILGGASLLAAGCGSADKSAPTTPLANPGGTSPSAGGSNPAGGTGPKSAGVVAFEAAHCNTCHVAPGSTKTGYGRGPDLTGVGAKRDKDWIVAHLRDPKAHNPMSRMPAAGPDKVSDQDAGVIGEYLAGLK